MDKTEPNAMKFVDKIWNKISRKKEKQWRDIEYFNPEWKSRIQNMAKFIQPKERVIDFGCGQMWLKEYLPNECHYIGVDYKARSAETIVCDFNAYQFPEDSADVAFISGCLEYIRDYEWFIRQLCRLCDKVIVSYCTMENFPDISDRIGRTWVNHLTHDEIINLFAKNNFRISGEIDATDTIFCFVSSKNNS